MRAAIERWAQHVWSGTGLTSTVLLPISWIIRAVSTYRARCVRRYPERAYHAPVPVVVVGNIMVGGTGKTPIVIALVEALRACGWTPGVVSRGYGARPTSQVQLSMDDASVQTLGDEPALIARQTAAPVAVHPQRVRAIRTLLTRCPNVDVIISDDGLQHLAMARDLEIIVQDERGTGNGRLLPAGPLREPACRLNRADWVITTLSAGSICASTTSGLTVQLRPTHVEHLATGENLDWEHWQARYTQFPCSALAAIGQPERFFTMLRASGINLAQTRALPDHDAFQDNPFADLPDAPVLITAKDGIKCKDLGDPRVWVVHVEPVFSDPLWIQQVDMRLKAIRHTLYKH
ncbi:tetraacyldisaccharide 4'-kinase [Alcaligenaceae bacterium CGII-47]|nr:tetraacyldisaccharide 4'-kinase [Alcaligenaceae bacterium CGII-47]